MYRKVDPGHEPDTSNDTEPVDASCSCNCTCRCTCPPIGAAANEERLQTGHFETDMQEDSVVPT